MDDKQKLMALIDSHLYDIKGIEESPINIQKACDYFKSELAPDSASGKEMDALCGQYAEIVACFLAQHAQPDFTNEMKDNCFDALTSIHHKMLAVAKPVMYQRFLHINTGTFNAEVNRQKPTYKELCRRLNHAVAPVNQHRKVGEVAGKYLTKAIVSFVVAIMLVLALLKQTMPLIANPTSAIPVVLIVSVLFFAGFIFSVVFFCKNYSALIQTTGLRRRADVSYTLCAAAVLVGIMSVAVAVLLPLF